MVPLKTEQILACLNAIARVRRPDTQLHLLGVTRTERVNDFGRYGVVSLDSTSPFQQSFKDDRDNYHTLERNYVAIRVMQIDGNVRLKRRILSGELDQNEGRRLELACLSSLTAYDRGEASLDATLDALDAYQCFLGESSHRSEYEVTLSAQPWKSCSCEVCADVGHSCCDLPRDRAQQAPRVPQPHRSSIAGFKRNSPRYEHVACPRTRDRPESWTPRLLVRS